jgi:hypothetical protein
MELGVGNLQKKASFPQNISNLATISKPLLGKRNLHQSGLKRSESQSEGT